MSGLKHWQPLRRKAGKNRKDSCLRCEREWLGVCGEKEDGGWGCVNSSGVETQRTPHWLPTKLRPSNCRRTLSFSPNPSSFSLSVIILFFPLVPPTLTLLYSFYFLLIPYTFIVSFSLIIFFWLLSRSIAVNNIFWCCMFIIHVSIPYSLTVYLL